MYDGVATPVRRPASENDHPEPSTTRRLCRSVLAHGTSFALSYLRPPLKSWFRQIADVARLLKQLRPYLGGGRRAPRRSPRELLVMVALEGIGVGLLVPLMSLLLGGESATPMRPLQWMEAQFPGHSPGFYVAAFCVAIMVTIGLKNAAGYVSQRFSAELKRRVAISPAGCAVRTAAACRSRYLRSVARRRAGQYLPRRDDPHHRAIDAVVALLQRSAVALFYVAALFYVSWPLTIWSSLLGLALGSALSFVYQASRPGRADLTELNHRIASTLEQGFAGVRIVRATNSQEREIAQFHRLNVAQADAEAANTEASSLMHPITETLAVVGAMAIIGCAYVFFVRPGLMLSSYLLGYGFFLLRLLPLLSQLYQIQGHLFYLAGGIREVDKWLNTPTFPDRPFGPRIHWHRARAALREGQLRVSVGDAGAAQVCSRSRRVGPWRSSGLGVRQVDACRATAPAARPHQRTHRRGRPSTAGTFPRKLAPRDRRGRAGRLPVFRHAPRQHSLRLAACDRGRAPSGDCDRKPRGDGGVAARRRRYAGR